MRDAVGRSNWTGREQTAFPANARDSGSGLAAWKSPVSTGDPWRALRLEAGESHVVADSRCKSRASETRFPLIGRLWQVAGTGKSGSS
jgi:hypothetical protein